MPINNPQKPQVEGSVLRPANRWKTLLFYQKANTLFQLTVVFCERFLPKYGDRTVDQMIQAARSGKQNIIEGSEDGKTSTEMELKLLNVARSSIGELQEDFVDYIQRKHLPLWDKAHPRYNAMRSFTQKYNRLEDYEPYFSKWNDEEMANIGLTLCHQVDYMMNKYLLSLEKLFVTQGGIKERMYAARTGFRKAQDEEHQRLVAENATLRAQLATAQNEIAQLRKLINKND